MALSKSLGLFVAGTALFAQGAQAQSLHNFHSEARTDMRASASLTIPLGARPRSDASKPRFDFVVERQSLAHSRNVMPLRFDANFERQKVRAAKVSFTLEQNPRLLLNDQRIATFGPRLTADDEDKDGGGDTVLYVVGGLALLGIITVVLVEEIDEVFEAPLRELNDEI